MNSEDNIPRFFQQGELIKFPQDDGTFYGIGKDERGFYHTEFIDGDLTKVYEENPDRPNPAWVDVQEGEEVGGGFMIEDGALRHFKLVCRGGHIVEESYEPE